MDAVLTIYVCVTGLYIKHVDLSNNRYTIVKMRMYQPSLEILGIRMYVLRMLAICSGNAFVHLLYTLIIIVGTIGTSLMHVQDTSIFIISIHIYSTHTYILAKNIS